MSEEGKQIPKPAGKKGFRRKLKDRKDQDGLYPLSVILTEVDEGKLAAIDEEFCCESESRATRIALKRWHRFLELQARRPYAIKPERPEFDVTASKNTGGKMKKIYATKEDLNRIKSLMELTERTGMAQVIRAAIGWQYEHLDI